VVWVVRPAGRWPTWLGRVSRYSHGGFNSHSGVLRSDQEDCWDHDLGDIRAGAGAADASGRLLKLLKMCDAVEMVARPILKGGS